MLRLVPSTRDLAILVSYIDPSKLSEVTSSIKPRSYAIIILDVMSTTASLTVVHVVKLKHREVSSFAGVAHSINMTVNKLPIWVCIYDSIQTPGLRLVLPLRYLTGARRLSLAFQSGWLPCLLLTEWITNMWSL